MHVPRPITTQIGELELNTIEDKWQDKNESEIHNDLINTRWKQNYDMIKEPYTPIMLHLYCGTWVH